MRQMRAISRCSVALFGIVFLITLWSYHHADIFDYFGRNGSASIVSNGGMFTATWVRFSASVHSPSYDGDWRWTQIDGTANAGLFPSDLELDRFGLRYGVRRGPNSVQRTIGAPYWPILVLALLPPLMRVYRLHQSSRPPSARKSSEVAGNSFNP